jgi:hypothetical protein
MHKNNSNRTILRTAATILILAGLVTSIPALATEQLKPFTTDGCSDFPNGTPKHRKLWLKCCIEHDKKYWMGGTYKQRLQADFDLRACVQAVGKPAIAELMLAGVRVGGSPWWPTRFRWGYGWPYPHGYRALTPDELEQARKLLEQAGQSWPQ